MENSNLSFLIWYKTMFFDERNQERFFYERNSKQLLGLKRYEPVWAMVHKLKMKNHGETEMRSTP